MPDRDARVADSLARLQNMAKAELSLSSSIDAKKRPASAGRLLTEGSKA